MEISRRCFLCLCLMGRGSCVTTSCLSFFLVSCDLLSFPLSLMSFRFLLPPSLLVTFLCSLLSFWFVLPPALLYFLLSCLSSIFSPVISCFFFLPYLSSVLPVFPSSYQLFLKHLLVSPGFGRSRKHPSPLRNTKMAHLYKWNISRCLFQKLNGLFYRSVSFRVKY